jgi:hypothetical protein
MKEYVPLKPTSVSLFGILGPSPSLEAEIEYLVKKFSAWKSEGSLAFSQILETAPQFTFP